MNEGKNKSQNSEEKKKEQEDAELLADYLDCCTTQRFKKGNRYFYRKT